MISPAGLTRGELKVRRGGGRRGGIHLKEFYSAASRTGKRGDRWGGQVDPSSVLWGGGRA